MLLLRNLRVAAEQRLFFQLFLLIVLFTFFPHRFGLFGGFD